ncbi:MAG: hypothetical protein AABY44_06650 [Nitrospirota bacterium]
MKRTIIFFILILIPLLSWADEKKANLIFYDQIVKPVEKVYLMANLRKGLISVKPEISGERVEFFQSNNDKKSLGITLTGIDGTAVKEIPPLKNGFHSFSARLADNKRYSAEESYGLVACWDHKKPIIIVDIDGTISDTDNSELLFKKTDKDSKPLKNAPDVLRRLSKKYNIIFLTHRNELLLNKTRLWLKEHKFPPAPVFTLRLGEDPLMPGEYKDEKLKEWKKEGWNMKIGIGNRPHDAEAYLDNGLKAIILDDDDDLPDKAIKVKDWKEIEKIILKTPDK